MTAAERRGGNDLLRVVPADVGRSEPAPIRIEGTRIVTAEAANQCWRQARRHPRQNRDPVIELFDVIGGLRERAPLPPKSPPYAVKCRWVRWVFESLYSSGKHDFIGIVIDNDNRSRLDFERRADSWRSRPPKRDDAAHRNGIMPPGVF